MIDVSRLWDEWVNFPGGYYTFITSKDCELEKAFLTEALNIQLTSKPVLTMEEIFEQLGPIFGTPLYEALK